MIESTVRKTTLFTAVALVATLAACGDSSSNETEESEKGCVEGRAVECRCSDGRPGRQMCRTDGTWAPCRCDGSAAGDVGTGADASESGESDGESSVDTGRTADTGASETSSGDGGGDSEPDTRTPEEYETITVAAGERRTFEVGPGETLENLLVDISADGADVFFDVVGGTLRDVGIRGEHPIDGTFAHVTAPDPDGEVLVENVYVGDGTDGDLGDATAFWVDATDEDAHRGVATFRHVYTAEFPDNAIYGSGPGFQLGVDEGGEVHIESCYSYNNNISNFRIGTNGSYVRDSVAVVPEDTNSPRHPNGRNARGVRAIEGATDMLVENSEIYAPDWEAVEVDGAATIRNSSLVGAVTGNATTENVDENVDKTPPPRVPTSPEEAAQGL